MLTKIGTKLNKNIEYRDQIEYKNWLWHVACSWVDTWTFKTIKK